MYLEPEENTKGFCPGDAIIFHCTSIHNTTELVWTITLPMQRPMMITRDTPPNLLIAADFEHDPPVISSNLTIIAVFTFNIFGSRIACSADDGSIMNEELVVSSFTIIGGKYVK